MRRYAVICMRILGVVLIAFILYRIQYRDLLILPDRGPVKGTVVSDGGEAWFEVVDSSERIKLRDGWEEREKEVQLGLFSNIRRSNKLLLAICALLFGPITLISITRWWYLLRKVDIPIGYIEALRLTFVGFFFNSAMPGLTGGDVVKAVYIARHAKGLGVRAFMSVYVDRIIGLFALGLLSGLILAPNLANEGLRGAALIVFVFLGFCVLFGALFLSGRLRRLVRLEAILRWLPFSHFFQEVDRAVVIYRRCPRAVIVALLLSLMNHISLVLVSLGMGRALGIDIPAYQFFIVVPVCMMVASIPLLPGGWGAREGAFVIFFGGLGVPATIAFALSVLIGLMQLAWSLLGGVFFFTRPDRVTAKDVETFSHDVGAEVDAGADVEAKVDAGASLKAEVDAGPDSSS